MYTYIYINMWLTKVFDTFHKRFVYVSTVIGNASLYTLKRYIVANNWFVDYLETLESSK